MAWHKFIEYQFDQFEPVQNFLSMQNQLNFQKVIHISFAPQRWKNDDFIHSQSPPNMIFPLKAQLHLPPNAPNTLQRIIPLHSQTKHSSHACANPALAT